jgi:hypothetical protein
MWHDVDFNLVQLITANKILNKNRKDTMAHTHTHYTKILPWKPKLGKPTTYLEPHL